MYADVNYKERSYGCLSRSIKHTQPIHAFTVLERAHEQPHLSGPL